jgi:uncharacterized protein with HEPN domain
METNDRYAYFDVDHAVVWKTVKDVLPFFSETLKKIIQDYYHL